MGSEMCIRDSNRSSWRHRDDAALLWRHELRLRSLRADAAQRDAASMKAERDAARAELCGNQNFTAPSC